MAYCGHVLSQFGLEIDGCRYPSDSDLCCQRMRVLICWHVLYDLFLICMLVDINVQIMHG